ncbi:hypothetical protein RB195_021875 [Necator americanus]|uniref:Reverse transcriptase domain-containing protein n=1 Tax=Necator americanus TaxID=51031 RepID=A0ABR1EF66_NECAM
MNLDSFYEKLDEVIRNENSCEFIGSDFNAKLGKATEVEYRIEDLDLGTEMKTAVASPGDLREAKPEEQAGFRHRFSCLDHVYTVSKVIEVSRKHRLSLVLTFVDYEEAFDSVETNAILSALVEQPVDAS